MKYLGIDYGSVRIGIAVAGDSVSMAFGRCVISNNSSAFTSIEKLLKDENIDVVVLGYPVSLKGTKTAQTLEVEKFESELRQILEKRFPGKVQLHRWDERLTSKMAQASMLESGMSKKNRRDKGNTDIISAAIMLQSFLDSKKYAKPACSSPGGSQTGIHPSDQTKI